MLDFLLVFSLPKLVYDDAMCGQVLHFVREVRELGDLPVNELIDQLMADQHLIMADHTMAMFLAAHRRLRLMHQLTVDAKWTEGRPYFKDIPRLYGQTIGLISFGNVAKAVARRCHAFGLHVIAYDPYLAELEMTAVGVEPVRELAGTSSPPHVYVCGPTPLVESVAASLVELGHQPVLVKTERFGPTGGSV